MKNTKNVSIALNSVIIGLTVVNAAMNATGANGTKILCMAALVVISCVRCMMLECWLDKEVRGHEWALRQLMRLIGIKEKNRG